MGEGPIRAVDRVFNIIETLRRRNGAGVSELAAELDMAKSRSMAIPRRFTGEGISTRTRTSSITPASIF